MFGLDDSGRDPLNDGLQHHAVKGDEDGKGGAYTPPEPGAEPPAPKAPDVPGTPSIATPAQMKLPPAEPGEDGTPPSAPDMPEAPAATPPEPPSAPAVDPKTFRFKGHAEAEAGYYNLRGHASRIEQENKTLRDQVTAREQEQRQLAIDAETGRQLEEFTNQAYSEMFEKINALDTDADDHDKQVAKLYADAALAVQRFKPTIDEKKLFGEEAPPEPGSPPPGSPPEGAPPPTMTVEDQEAAQQLLATRTAALGAELSDPVFRFFAGKVAKVDAAGNPLKLEQQIDAAASDTRSYLVGEYAKQSNLDPQDPLVVHYTSACPTVDAEGKPIPLAYQAAFVIRQVQAYKERHVSQVLQNVNAPMSSGMPTGAAPGAPGTPGAPTGPVSLDDALNKARTSRTL